MTNSLRTLLVRAKDISKEEGLSALFKSIFFFVISKIASNNSFYYVYRNPMKEGNEADYLPKVQNFTHRIVETVQQLDELSNEGFDLSLIDIKQYRHRLKKGAILSLVFVDRELGHVSWLALTEKAKRAYDRYPYRVDFANNEACSGDSWTNPKYRRQGLAYYATYKGRQFHMGKGANTWRGIVLTDNTASIAWSAKLGSGIVATAYYARIFGLQFWRETPTKSTNDKNN